MFIALKTKIWLTVSTIVLLFTFFTLIYFPAKQGQSLLKNYNDEIQNQANTVALGVRIALKEQNYEGVQTAMDFVKGSSGFKFVSLLQVDTIRGTNPDSMGVQETVFSTFPESEKPSPGQVSSDSIIIKRAPFETEMMSGAIMVGFSTDEIKVSQAKIRKTSLIASGGIFILGWLLGLWLARTISLPVLALRNAARRVGEGDLTATIQNISNDEIGELSKAFNSMVKDISKARQDLRKTNDALSDSNQLLNNTVTDLKSTQAQLIQSEKMASLGELTAGIAHEIQNPLNFVNNFSEVNTELIDELQDELKSGNIDEAISISKSIRENEEKIVHHGKRADTIVKGMLQHSRTSTGAKEPTDINALADEYLRLAYHGLRAKDKTFNVTMKTDFDPSIGCINIIPQDIGRVILNLITNAFHAVSTPKGDTPFSPTVIVSTNRIISPRLSKGDAVSGEERAGETNGIEIHVADNGPGVPQHILDKIFQPFFTTKPTGQGTGLGLSLSYDIVKSHGGEIRIKTKEGEGTEFIVSLPK